MSAGVLPRLGSVAVVWVVAASCFVGSAAAAGPRYSNHGVRLPLSTAVQRALIVHHRSSHIYRLLIVGRLTFFRFGDSALCFGAKRDFRLAAVTPASVPGVFGGYVCRSQLSTIMDFSVVGASRSHPVMHIELLAGVAADGIAKIQLLASDGRILGSTPVIRNAYGMLHVPPGAVSLRGVTTSGKLLPKLP
jgi:hypothetical protein